MNELPKTGLEFPDADVVQLNGAGSGGAEVRIVFAASEALVRRRENLSGVDRYRDGLALHNDFHSVPFAGGQTDGDFREDFLFIAF